MKRERIEEIAELLDKRGKLTLEQLEEYFPNVSQMTLRRDLFQLEEEGKIIRVRGGAMSVKEVQKASGEPYTKKATIHTDEKIEIAQKAAVLVDEGSSIFIDGGTTALYLAKELRDMNCNVFTNGIAVAKELAQKKNVTINLLGGQLIKETCPRPPRSRRNISRIRISSSRSSPLRRLRPKTDFPAARKSRPTF